MISVAYPINDEGLRLIANLEQHYAAWLDSARVLLPGRLAWKKVGDGEYLYRIVDGKGNGRSQGPRSRGRCHRAGLQPAPAQRVLRPASPRAAG